MCMVHAVLGAELWAGLDLSQCWAGGRAEHGQGWAWTGLGHSQCWAGSRAGHGGMTVQIRRA